MSSLPASAEPNPLRLAPEPGAAREARAWIAEVLAGWPEETVETARLVVSELVTNSVLHAGTPIGVAYRLDGERARFEVTDGQPVGPLPKRYATDSATGRGLRLVASLADEWGVARDPQGKSVWFTVSPSTRAYPLFDQASSAAEFESYPSETTAPPATKGSAEDVDVKIVGLPVDVYLEAEQHNDAVLRELTLIVQSAESPSGIEVPRRLLELADEVRTAFAPRSARLRTQVEDAIRHGRKSLDIQESVPREGWQALLRLADWLDEVDRYCVEGDLLTLASSPRLRRFRTWFSKQVADQMEGLPPTPWEPTP